MIKSYWVCLNCDNEFKSKALATNCCGVEFVDSLYRCRSCRNYFDTKKAALNCCGNVAHKFICPVCDLEHSSYGEALYCCPNKYDPFWQMRIDGAVLEKYGQQRLFD